MIELSVFQHVSQSVFHFGMVNLPLWISVFLVSVFLDRDTVRTAK